MKYSALLLLVLSIPSFGLVLFGPPNAKTVTTTSTQMMPANSLRAYIIIVNTGATPVVVKFGGVQSSATEGVLIPPGGNYEPLETPANSLYAVTASSTSTLEIVEGQ